MASRSWNRVELIGNLTRDPELRYTPSGAAVCTFGIATNRVYVSEGEKKEEVDFHRLVAWNKLAELCSQLLKKGNRVFISGRLQNRSWEGQDGVQRTTTEIVVEDMILLTPKSDSASSNLSGDVEVTKTLSPKEVAKEEVLAENIEPPVSEEPKEEPSKPKTKPATEDVDEDLPF